MAEEAGTTGSELPISGFRLFASPFGLGSKTGLKSGVALLGIREQQKRDRRHRIFAAAMRLFERQGFEATTVLAIAKAARVSRGTVFNYFPYKEAILLEHLAAHLQALEARVRASPEAGAPLLAMQRLFDELAAFVEANRHLVLPLSYELLNPDPERSRAAYTSLPLPGILHGYLRAAQAQGLVRQDFSAERLARTLANTFFLTCLQWAAYRQDRAVQSELRTALTLALEGVVGCGERGE
jgi:AcrR family transcriptional regulator